MHGAAPPYAWQGLSPYDMYQQAAQALQPPAVLPPLPAQPHVAHMPSVISPRLQAPWGTSEFKGPPADLYLHKLHGMNGFPHKPLFESSYTATESALSTHPASYTVSDRSRNETDLFASAHSGVYKPLWFEHTLQTEEKRKDAFSEALFSMSSTATKDLPGFHATKSKMESSAGVAQSVIKDIPSSILPSVPPPGSFEAATSGSYSHLKWKSAYISPSSSSTTSSCFPSNLSTSREFMPVTTTAASYSVIPYKPRDHTAQPVANGAFNSAAIKEAGRILEEASLSNLKSGFTVHDRKPNLPFTNISNEYKQQSSASDLQGLHRPSSSHNTYLGSPLDIRPENAWLRQLSSTQGQEQSTEVKPGMSAGPIPGHPGSIVQNHQAQVQGDFWSEFGIPPPNVALDQTPQIATNKASKRNGSFLSHPDELMKANKRTKQDDPEKGSTADTPTTEETGNEKTDEKKKPEKLTRRKSFTEDPAMEALVDAKVQEIMAACKEKQHQKTGVEKPKPLKSPKHGIQSNDLHYDKKQTGVYGFVEQASAEQSFQHDSVTMMKGSVYDFNESDQHFESQNKHLYPHKDLSQQVMDMRFYRKQNISSNHMPEQKPASGPMLSLSDQINEMREKSKIPRPNSGEVHSHHENHMNSLGERTSGIQHSKINSADVFNKGHIIDSKLDTNNQSSDNILFREVCEKERENHTGKIRDQCCVDCNSLGKSFSENCLNHKHKVQASNDVKFDAFQFSDELSNVGPYNKDLDNASVKVNSNYTKPYSMWNNTVLKSEHDKFVRGYEKMHAEAGVYNDIKHNVQYYSENKKTQSFDKYNGFYKKGFKSEKSSQKVKSLSSKFDRPQGQGSTSKKIGSRPLSIKSSLSLLKKSQKFQHLKLPSIRQKWRNNPKYKKVTKDDFAEKLMKNLGFPPLTLKDLMAKKHCSLPKGYVNGHSTIAASMLSAEDKAASRGTLPVADNTTTQADISKGDNTHSSVANGKSHVNSIALTGSSNNHVSNVTPVALKMSERSKSLEPQQPGTENNGRPMHRSRSWSFDDIRKGSGVGVSVDDAPVMQIDQSKVKTISDQISDLRAKVTGNQNNLELNTVIEMPKCGCLGVDGLYSESVEGPYYTHLGSGRSVEAIRKTLEQRTGETGRAIRIEKVRYTGREGKSKKGCPIAKWIVRRSSTEEKYLALIRHRDNHTCETAWLIVGLVAWEGVPATQADDLYDFLSTTLPPYGNETERRCGTNDSKTCACQGADLMKRGASFSFGCSWSMYFNGCKFARSAHVRKFRLKNEDKESLLEDKLQELATQVGPLYERCAPDAHANQCYYSDKGKDCRLGEKGPFSGVTACVDFCAHAHKDIHNMNNGSTVVVTLTKHRGLSKPDDEQLHVLPLYVLEPTDEAGSYGGQYEKIRGGSLEVLHQFPLEARMRAHPLESCKKRRMNKKGRGGHRQAYGGRLSEWDSSSSAQSTPQKDYLHSQDSNQSAPSVNGSNSNTPVKQPTVKFDMTNDKPISYDDLMAVSTQAGFDQLYSKFWDYFYAFGVFPPPSILAASLQGSSWIRDDPQNVDSHKYESNKRQQTNSGQKNTAPAVDSSVPSHTTQSQEHINLTSRHENAVKVDNPFSDPPSQHNSTPPSGIGEAHQNLPTGKQPNDVHASVPIAERRETVLGNTVYNTPAQQSAADLNLGRDYDRVQTTSTQHHQTGVEGHSTSVSNNLQFDSQALDLSFSASTKKSSVVVGYNQLPHEPPSSSNRNQSGVEHSSVSQSAWNRMECSKGPSGGSNLSPLDLLSQTVDTHSKRVGFTGSSAYSSYHRDVSDNSKMAENMSAEYRGVGNVSNLPYQYGQEDKQRCEQKQSSLPQYNKQLNTDGYNQPINVSSKQIYHHVPNVSSSTEEVTRSSQSTNNISPYHSQLQPGTRPVDFSPQQYEQVGMTAGNQHWKPYDPNKLACHEKLSSVNNGESTPEKEPSLLDPDVVKCEMEYNEEAFIDPNIGGVAIALNHGAVLFEVAKRELHATTGLKNPNRYHPTRISLVFYQHKNLNNERHGMYFYQKKLEDLKMKRIEQMQLERGYVDMQEIENSFKGGKKRKVTDEEAEVAKLLQSASGEYRYMWDCNTQRAESVATNTVSTKWIDPAPIVTGPYQKWL